MQTSFSLTVRGKTLRGIAHLPEQEHSQMVNYPYPQM